MKIPWKPFLFSACALLIIFAYPAWERWMNAHILKERDYTFKVNHDALILATRIAWADLERARSNEPSIYPTDLGMKDTATYIDFLKKNEILTEPLETDLHSLRFGNVSRADSENTIFILSSDTMRNIHVIIH